MMRLTKFSHACFSVDKDGATLLVDPGGLTDDLVIAENVAAVLYTHNHQDHFDTATLDAVLARNPEAVIIGPQDVTSQLEHFDTKTVTDGDTLQVAGFDLQFYGQEHAIIHPDLPYPMNVGILFDTLLYYPGDSFTIPEAPVDTLALPIAAPWLKLEDAIDFYKAVAPRFAFPTHDAVLSATGQGIVDSMMQPITGSLGLTYERIDGQTIDIGA